MSLPPSGEQFEIRAGGRRATIVEVGGGLRKPGDSVTSAWGMRLS